MECGATTPTALRPHVGGVALRDAVSARRTRLDSTLLRRRRDATDHGSGGTSPIGRQRTAQPERRTVWTCLTGAQTRARMAVAMRNRIRRWIRPLGWALAVVLAVAWSASCAAGAEPAATESTCCAAMGDDCDHGAPAQREDCCPDENGLQAGAGKRLSVAAPTLIPTGVLPDPATPARPSHTHSTHRRCHSFDSPRVPTYLLVSALLI